MNIRPAIQTTQGPVLQITNRRSRLLWHPLGFTLLLAATLLPVGPVRGTALFDIRTCQTNHQTLAAQPKHHQGQTRIQSLSGSPAQKQESDGLELKTVSDSENDGVQHWAEHSNSPPLKKDRDLVNAHSVSLSGGLGHRPLNAWSIALASGEASDNAPEKPKDDGIKPMKVWDYEDETVQNWGIYPDKPPPQKSPDLACADTPSPGEGLGHRSLKVSNIKISGPIGSHSFEKLIAVQCSGKMLSGSRLTAKLYLSSGEADDVQTADAKFFVFDDNWKWFESGNQKKDRMSGEELLEKDWSDLSWDVDLPGSVSLQNILGIKIRIETVSGTPFKGSVYIDFVKVSKRPPNG